MHISTGASSIMFLHQKIDTPPRLSRAVVAEWLRRLTRNQLGSARTGSNPVHCDLKNGFTFAGVLRRSGGFCRLFVTEVVDMGNTS